MQEADSKPEQPKIAEKPTFEDDFFDSISSDATGQCFCTFCADAMYDAILIGQIPCVVLHNHS